MRLVSYLSMLCLLSLFINSCGKPRPQPRVSGQRSIFEEEKCAEFIRHSKENCSGRYARFKHLYDVCKGYQLPPTEVLEGDRFEMEALSIVNCFLESEDRDDAKRVYRFMLNQEDFQADFMTHKASFHEFAEAELERIEAEEILSMRLCLDQREFAQEVESFILTSNLDRMQELVDRPFSMSHTEEIRVAFSDVKALILKMLPFSNLKLVQKIESDRCFWIKGWKEVEKTKEQIWGICETAKKNEKTGDTCYYWTAFSEAPDSLYETIYPERFKE